jgi:hypothetical protein
MDRSELKQYLDVAAGHSVVVDVREVPGLPGIVRTITVHRDQSVTIEYDRARAYVEGEIEGYGPKLIAKYDALDALVEDLAGFLSMPIEQWRNYSKERFEPAVLDDPDPAQTMTAFEDMVRTRSIPLPEKGRYEFASPYWRHILKYGQYRPDMVFEEQNEHFGVDDESTDE